MTRKAKRAQRGKLVILTSPEGTVPWPQSIPRALRTRLLRDAVVVNGRVVADIVTAAHALDYVVSQGLPADEVERGKREAALDVVSSYLRREARRLDERQDFTRKLAAD